MRLLKQSTTRDVMVFMALASDHVTGATGLTLTITASKNGGAFASITPTVTERGNGWYALALTATHTDTAGDFALHVTGTAADPADPLFHVVAFDFADAVRLGLTALPNAVAGAANGLLILGSNTTVSTGLVIANTDANNPAVTITSTQHRGLAITSDASHAVALTGVRSAIFATSGAAFDTIDLVKGVGRGTIDGDLTAPDEATGVPTTLSGMLRRACERFGRNKKVRVRTDATTAVVSLRNAADDGNLEQWTQSVTTGTNTDTQTAGA